MTVAVTPKAAAPAAASTAARIGSPAADAAPDGNAFLLALGACSAEADIAPVDPAASDSSPVTLTALATDALPLATPADPPVPAVALPAEPALPVVDAAALLAQAPFSAMAATPPSAPTAPPPVVNSPSATASATTAAITATAAPAPATPVLKGAGDVPAKPASAATAAAVMTQLPPDEAVELAVPSRGVVHAGNGTASAPYTHPALMVSQAQAALSQAAAAPSDTRALAHIATAVAEPALQASFASSATAPRRSDRTGERSSSMFSSASGVDMYPAFAPGGSALMPAIDAASAGAAGGQAGLAERLVEQVSWWLSQRTQGAELTLDVPGGSPVSVSIQVQGNEAQVAFRSDQPEARQLLANTMQQLKDMLGAEGLLLSGASVGTSGGGGRPGDAASGRPARAGQIGVDAAPAPTVTPRPLPSGRTLDLYV